MGQRLNTSDPRFKSKVSIFNGPTQQNLKSNYSVNMSTGGVFIETVNIFPVNASLILIFKLPDIDTIITCKARVAWIKEPGDFKKFSLPSGMGLQFLDLSPENKHAIRDYLNKSNLVPTS